MAEKKKLEYFLLRYVPDAVKEEFVNFGLAMIERPTSGAGFADVRFTRDWRQVLCLDPQADLAMLQATGREIQKLVVEMRNIEEVIETLNKSFSNLVQLSEAKGCLTEDPVKEIETMARMYLKRTQVPLGRKTSGRQDILNVMEESFERAGVTGFMKPFPVADYTYATNKFQFDFGYQVGNEIKLFQAVSFKSGTDYAGSLALQYPKIARGLSGKGIVPTLTATVDNGPEQLKDEIGFVLGMMAESKIVIANVSQMPAVAEAAKIELRA
jgi:Protein of unknown function (DUF3037)